ncbi:MAG: hypothetical protein AAFU85_19625, partial [Planctomycetota bacterium]
DDLGLVALGDHLILPCGFRHRNGPFLCEGLGTATSLPHRQLTESICQVDHLALFALVLNKAVHVRVIETITLSHR